MNQKIIFSSPFQQIGNASFKNRAFTDTNDASFDSTYSAYMLDNGNKQFSKMSQQSLNLSQSLSNIVDVSALGLAKDKYFEKPSMVSHICFPILFSFLFEIFEFLFFLSTNHFSGHL